MTQKHHGIFLLLDEVSLDEAKDLPYCHVEWQEGFQNLHYNVKVHRDDENNIYAEQLQENAPHVIGFNAVRMTPSIAKKKEQNKLIIRKSKSPKFTKMKQDFERLRQIAGKL